MAGKRYSEGGDPVDLNFPDRQNRYTPQEALRKKRRTKIMVPVGDSFMSDTSDARECFVNRKNSKKFQEFIISYSYVMVTTKVLSGEV